MEFGEPAAPHWGWKQLLQSQIRLQIVAVLLCAAHMISDRYVPEETDTDFELAPGPSHHRSSSSRDERQHNSRKHHKRDSSRDRPAARRDASPAGSSGGGEDVEDGEIIGGDDAAEAGAGRAGSDVDADAAPPANGTKHYPADEPPKDKSAHGFK